MKGKLTSLLAVDLAACKAKGVLTGNTPGVLDDTTADLVLTLLLATARRVPEVSVP
jgi:glyoxylate reductase